MAAMAAAEAADMAAKEVATAATAATSTTFLETESTAMVSSGATGECKNDEVSHELVTYSKKIRFFSTQNCDKDAEVIFQKLNIEVKGEPCDGPEEHNLRKAAHAEYDEMVAKSAQFGDPDVLARKSGKDISKDDWPLGVWDRIAPKYEPGKNETPGRSGIRGERHVSFYR